MFSLNCLVFEARGELLRTLSLTMSALICEVSDDVPSACLLPQQGNVNRLVTLLHVYQIYADTLVKLFDELRDMEVQLGAMLPAPLSKDEEVAFSTRFIEHLAKMKGSCVALELSSAEKQVNHIITTIDGKLTSGAVIAPKLGELRRRICEDLEDHVYICVPHRTAHRFFKRDEHRRYVFKVAAELMDPKIVERFPSASDDIEDTFRCFVCEFYPASMFHLMRVLEVAVLEVGEIAGVTDRNPSWGAVLQHVEKVVLRTKYEALPELVKPHRKILEAILPQMQSIQRAWRNKFSHVNNKIIPVSPIDERVATEVLTAVEAFMRQMAYELPTKPVE
jgi:hypothetical protein